MKYLLMLWIIGSHEPPAIIPERLTALQCETMARQIKQKVRRAQAYCIVIPGKDDKSVIIKPTFKEWF